MNKAWERSFAEGWDELFEGQRFERAKYLVESGLNKGASIKEIARASQRSGHPVSDMGVSELLDLYAVQKGANSSLPLAAGKIRLKHAMAQYDANVSRDEVKEYAEEHGYSEGVAGRLLRGEQIGAAMAEDGLINDDGELVVSDPRSTREVEGETRFAPTYGTPTAFQWSRRFTKHSSQLDDFFGFLKATKQDAMSDKVIAPRLRRMAEQLERQADRFATGYEKCAAKTRAKKSKGV